jgi:LPS sulfotransferase NodH
VTGYLLCATPRTGSSLLCGLLDSTGVAGHPQAYFRPTDEPEWAARFGLPPGYSYRRFVAAAVAAAATPNGVWGAKVMWDAFAELLDRAAVPEPVRFVRVRRGDRLAQAVSWWRAEQTGIWFDGGHGETGATPTGREPRYDAAAIDRLVATAEAEDAAWSDWFAAAGIEPFEVRYERLAADPAGVTREVLGFLGVDLPAGRIIRARHRRQTDAVNRQWIARHGSSGDASR